MRSPDIYDPFQIFLSQQTGTNRVQERIISTTCDIDISWDPDTNLTISGKALAFNANIFPDSLSTSVDPLQKPVPPLPLGSYWKITCLFRNHHYGPVEIFHARRLIGSTHRC